MIATVLTAGCASMSKDECLAVDWRTIGYEDGVEGYPGDHIAEHRKACAKYGVRADLDLYQQGRNQGLREFCQPRNGYRLGARGASYNGVCSGELETPFLASFDSGHQLYVLGARLSNAEAQLESKRRELANIEHGILSNSVEAVSTDSASEPYSLAMYCETSWSAWASRMSRSSRTRRDWHPVPVDAWRDLKGGVLPCRGSARGRG